MLRTRNRKFLAAAAFLAFTSAAHTQPPAIEWELDYEASLDRARAENKPLLIDFYADWCGPCKMMDAQTFPDPRVVAAVANFVPVKVDVDANEKVAFAYKIRSIPRTVVLNVYDEMVGDRVGFLSADEYLGFLQDVAEYTHRRVDGVVVTLPETVDGTGEALVAVNADTTSDRLYELLIDPNSDVRRAARGELIRRGDDAVNSFLQAALSHEYLGMRIAAGEILEATDSEKASKYDAWAVRAQADSR
ncbi:MAG: thioredoxin family protein [Candidatus Hydrogenedentales bacterium]